MVEVEAEKPVVQQSGQMNQAEEDLVDIHLEMILVSKKQGPTQWSTNEFNIMRMLSINNN